MATLLTRGIFRPRTKPGVDIPPAHPAVVPGAFPSGTPDLRGTGTPAVILTLALHSTCRSTLDSGMQDVPAEAGTWLGCPLHHLFLPGGDPGPRTRHPRGPSSNSPERCASIDRRLKPHGLPHFRPSTIPGCQSGATRRARGRSQPAIPPRARLATYCPEMSWRLGVQVQSASQTVSGCSNRPISVDIRTQSMYSSIKSQTPSPFCTQRGPRW